MNLPEEEMKTPQKLVVVKQEVKVSPEKKLSTHCSVYWESNFQKSNFCALLQETAIEEDLPKKLVLVEFRCLTVAAPPKVKPQKMQEISYTKNFKCFRKVGLRYTEHNRNTQRRHNRARVDPENTLSCCIQLKCMRASSCGVFQHCVVYIFACAIFI